MVSLFLELQMTQVNDETSDRKKEAWIHVFYFGLPTSSLELVAPKEWFTIKICRFLPGKQFETLGGQQPDKYCNMSLMEGRKHFVGV